MRTTALALALSVWGMALPSPGHGQQEPDIRALCEDRDGDVEKGLSACNKRLELAHLSDEARSVTHYFRALHVMRKGDTKAGREDCEASIRYNPRYGLGYNCRGFVLQTLGDLDGALAAYTEAVTADPDLKRAYANRGNIYLRRDEFRRALAEFEHVIRIEPTDPAGFAARGLCLENLGEIERARKDYETALDLPPDKGGWAHKVARERLAALGPNPRALR